MSNKGEHFEYIAHKGLFNVDCSHEIFSPEELQILEKWGHWFSALISGDLKPFTEGQEKFVKVMKGEVKATTLEEIVWFRYLGRKEYEKKHGDRLKVRYESENDEFYSREHKKKMDKINFSTMSWNHRRGWSEK